MHQFRLQSQTPHKDTADLSPLCLGTVLRYPETVTNRADCETFLQEKVAKLRSDKMEKASELYPFKLTYY